MEVARLQVAFEPTGQRAVQSAIGQTDKSIRDLAANSERSANRMGSAFSGAGKAIALGMGILAAAGVAKMATGFLMANANAEQLRVTLDIATGSAERAALVFDTMQKMAAATPFEFRELAAGAARIESFGQDSTKVMQTIGDTAAGTMRSIDQVTAAYLDAGMGQFIRLQELGIDASVVGDEVVLKWVENGKTITKAVDKNNGQMIQSTIAAIWNKKYEGAMKKQSKTFLGQWSTLKDNFNLTMQAMTKGVFDFAKGGLSEANQFFDLFNKKLDQGLDPVHAALSALHVTLDQVFGKAAGDKIDAVLRGIVDSIGAVGRAVGALAGDLLRGDIGAFFSDLGSMTLDLGDIAVNVGKWVLSEGIPDLWDWFKKQIGVGPRGDGTDPGATVTLGDVLIDAALALGGSLLAISQDVGGWLKTQLLKGQQELINLGVLKITGAPDLRNLNQKFSDALNRINWSNLGFEAGRLTRALAIKFGEAIAGLAAWVSRGDNWKIVAGAALVGIAGIPLAIGYVGKMLFPKAAEFLGGFLEGLGLSWPAIVGWFHGMGAALLLAIPDLKTTLKQKGIDLIQGVMDGKDEQWAFLKTWFSHLGDFVFSAIPDVTASLLQKGIDLIQGVMDGRDTQWAYLKTWFSNLGVYVVDAVPDVAGYLWDTGFNLVWGMAQGVYAGAQLVIDAVTSIVSSIPGPVRSLLGIGSPSKVMIDLFRHVPEGAAIGMMQGVADIQRAAQRMAYASLPTVSPSYASAGAATRARGRSSGLAASGPTYIIHGDLLATRDWERKVIDLANTGAVKIVDTRTAARGLAGR